MKKSLILVVILLLFTAFIPVCAKNCSNNDIVVKNKYFAIYIPNEFKGLYTSKIKKDTIEIFDKESKKAGFGGFVFGIRVYKNPSDHATLPGSIKLGELKDKNGILYDVVLKHPTDVQYDYTKSTTPPETHKNLYDLGDKINITGIKGSKYYKNQGTKGEDLYKEVLQKHFLALNEKWNSAKLEKENMSYMYNVLAHNSNDLLNKVGYAYYDVNKDGIDELFIGEIAQGNWKGVVYDVYTMVDRKPQHVISGGARNRFYVCDDAFICNEYSSGAGESGVRVYILIENGIELFPQVSFKYDSYKNKKNPYFISYGSELNDDKWENVSEQVFNERKYVFDRYNRFDYIPFSTLILK